MLLGMADCCCVKEAGGHGRTKRAAIGGGMRGVVKLVVLKRVYLSVVEGRLDFRGRRFKAFRKFGTWPGMSS